MGTGRPNKICDRRLTCTRFAMANFAVKVQAVYRSPYLVFAFMVQVFLSYDFPQVTIFSYTFLQFNSFRLFYGENITQTPNESVNKTVFIWMVEICRKFSKNIGCNLTMLSTADRFTLHLASLCLIAYNFIKIYIVILFSIHFFDFQFSVGRQP